ncbi:MAG TPA: YraN family protein [Fimbriimonadaceae bacterium]|nr:YraN family protein [Fimbriimonadaceae bacterium]
MPDLRRVGRAAEDRAAEYLIGKGYTIVTRRFAIRGGEIDLVALDGDTIVFVEVKAHMAKPYVPEEALSSAKAESLRRAALKYLEQVAEPDRRYRFDFIAIDREGIRHHADVI